MHQNTKLIIYNANDKECSICKSDDLITLDNCYITVCSHMFHKECVEDWHKISDKCAMCNTDDSYKVISIKKETNNFVNISRDIYNMVWLNIKCNMTYYHISTNKEHTFVLYDKFTVSEDTYASDDEDGYTLEELLSPMFAQPDYAFIIDNGSDQISSKMNCEQMMFKINTDKLVSTWTYCDLQYSEELFNQVKHTLEYAKVSEETVTFKPYSSWVIYDCAKTVYNFVP